MAASFGVPFLGRVPIEPALTRACEAGRRSLPGSPDVVRPIADRILASTEMEREAEEAVASMMDGSL